MGRLNDTLRGRYLSTGDSGNDLVLCRQDLKFSYSRSEVVVAGLS